MKSRFLKTIIEEKSKKKFGRIIILTGARQTGKTTLAKFTFPGYQYLSVEDPVLRMEYKILSAEQWKTNYPLAILDEVQKEPQLIESIKSVYDQYDEPRYILMGSSQLLLLQKVKESLAGRCSVYEIFPLTFPEMLTNAWDEPPRRSFFQKFCTTLSLPSLPPSFQMMEGHAKKIGAFDQYLNFGGYPALFDSALSSKDKREWLADYTRTYLERDIRDLADFKQLEPFVKIQKITALLTGNLVNYSQLAKEADVSSNTARRFLTYMELSYQTIMLQPWHKNNFKRLHKSPKLHYLDPGIQRSILRKQGALSGNEFESAVVAEIYKQIKTVDLSCEMYHLRTFDGRETDLLLELENGYIAIEIKMTSSARKTDARHLSGLEEFLDKPLIQSFVLSNDMGIKQLAPGITAMPAAMFLA